MTRLGLGVAVGTAVVLGVASSGPFGAGADVSTVAGQGVVDPGVVGVGSPDAVRLVAFDSCPAVLEAFKRAASPHVGPYGLQGNLAYGQAGSAVIEDQGRSPMERGNKAGAPQPLSIPAAPAAGATAEKGAAPKHSTTNNHEAGVDEPDLVKTDGRRVLSVADGKLRVVDVASRQLTGTLELPGGTATELLTSGDRALVVVNGESTIYSAPPELRKPVPSPPRLSGSRLVLVDLAGAPKILGTLNVEGSYLDARQVGGVARVVVRSRPNLPFVYPNGTRTSAIASQENRELVAGSAIGSWLPRYELEQNGTTQSGQLVDCQRVSRPASYSATSMLTVLSFDLGKTLGTGDPVSIVADGDTVYGTGTSLYVADDHFQSVPLGGGGIMPRLPQRSGRTEIHQFDIAKAGPPRHIASGAVDGALLNQYSLSEHDGNLRVATTVTTPGPQPRSGASTQSMITVLARKDRELVAIGKVDGLGVGERIYSVRFMGAIGYVVTFRQTDPLYTVDLSDPKRPRVVGELKITGYSAYLHPGGDGRLIGVGQEATEQGRTQGTQVSLFDVGDLAKPKLVAKHHVRYGHSEVEFDPHAFLYWPQDGLLVIPVTTQSVPDMPTAGPGKPGSSIPPKFAPPQTGALVLRLKDGAFTEVGTVRHVDQRGLNDSVRRALVIDGALWTVSNSGVMVSDQNTVAQQAWLPFR